MSDQSERLKERALAFAVDVLRGIDHLPRTVGNDVLARQMAKSATSVAANYRAACIARSRAEFIAKLGIVLEEADETCCWLDMLTRLAPSVPPALLAARHEAQELRAIFGRSLGTARLNQRAIRANARDRQ